MIHLSALKTWINNKLQLTLNVNEMLTYTGDDEYVGTKSKPEIQN